MIRIFRFDAHGKAIASEALDFICPPPEGTTCWIDLEKPDIPLLELLGDKFGFHPLTLEDCAQFDQIPKLEDYGDYMFLVMHGLQLNPHDKSLDTIELHSFLGANYLVTVHDRALPSLDVVWKRMEGDARAAQRGMDFVRYLVADALVDDLYPIIDRLADDTEAIEQRLIEIKPPKAVLIEILRIKLFNAKLRKALIPQRNIIASLTRFEEKFISEKTLLYFRDVYDHLLRITETLESNREMLEGLLMMYQWAISQRTNEIMKRLTILSAIFLPLTFITGFFGQNFTGLPFGSTALMAGMLSACVTVPVCMLWYFLRSKWI